ncbi:MAG: hypothetical protein IKO69_01035 [Acidaminococcaceae bacterium]|nr:hypothetical protein [Acidaminococcaceae bacterium]
MSLIENFVQNHVDLLKRNDYIDPSLYKEYGVKSGLRNEDGKGVLAGLTNISQIISENIVDGKKQPCDGELWYRGHRINGLIEDLGDELALLENMEAVAPGIIAKARNLPQPPDPNIDFYSGALYYMLDVPPSLFIAFFSIARVVGWSAHRLEELITSNKIIRPAYKSVMKTEA